MKKSHLSSNTWLTDFCDNLRIFVSVIVVQIVVVVYSLSFLAFDFEFLRKLSILTLLAQLLGLVLLILMCKLRSVFNGLGVYKGAFSLILLVVVVSSILSQIIGFLDMQLTFHLFQSQLAVNYLNFKLSLSAVVITLALIRYYYIQDQWSRQVQMLADARLNALQARIKPHFLFNSLNSIASLISIDAQRAEMAVSDFSSLMRQTFAHKDKNISIEEELNCVKQYLAIEDLRLDDRLSYAIGCGTELLPLKIPILCVQPLVENAIIHGIQPLEHGGHIEIKLIRTNDRVLINVVNPYRQSLQLRSNGMALNNIKERLQLQYGKLAELVIKEENGMYNVTIGIPV